MVGTVDVQPWTDFAPPQLGVPCLGQQTLATFNGGPAVLVDQTLVSDPYGPGIFPNGGIPYGGAIQRIMSAHRVTIADNNMIRLDKPPYEPIYAAGEVVGVALKAGEQPTGGYPPNYVGSAQIYPTFAEDAIATIPFYCNAAGVIDHFGGLPLPYAQLPIVVVDPPPLPPGRRTVRVDVGPELVIARQQLPVPNGAGPQDAYIPDVGSFLGPIHFEAPSTLDGQTWSGDYVNFASLFLTLLDIHHNHAKARLTIQVATTDFFSDSTDGQAFSVTDADKKHTVFFVIKGEGTAAFGVRGQDAFLQCSPGGTTRSETAGGDLARHLCEMLYLRPLAVTPAVPPWPAVAFFNGPQGTGLYVGNGISWRRCDI